MESAGNDDPNRRVLAEIARQLGAAKDAKGRKLQVVRVPSPGVVKDASNKVMPASYLNFYIGNASVSESSMLAAPVNRTAMHNTRRAPRRTPSI